MAAARDPAKPDIVERLEQILGAGAQVLAAPFAKGELSKIVDSQSTAVVKTDGTRRPKPVQQAKPVQTVKPDKAKPPPKTQKTKGEDAVRIAAPERAQDPIVQYARSLARARVGMSTHNSASSALARTKALERPATAVNSTPVRRGPSAEI